MAIKTDSEQVEDLAFEGICAGPQIGVSDSTLASSAFTFTLIRMRSLRGIDSRE